MVLHLASRRGAATGESADPVDGIGVDHSVADGDLHHGAQDDLVLFGFAAQSQRDEVFEVAVELAGGGLPDLQPPK